MTRARVSGTFADRRTAGRLLGQAFASEVARDTVVVGLARGGVAVAAEVARTLGLPLDAVAVRKVGHPWQPEYAIGAVAPHGVEYVRGGLDLPPELVAAAVSDATARSTELEARLHARRPRVPLAGRACLLVDDGLATGATMIAAVRWARREGASRVVVGVPVGAPETVQRLAREADQVLALETPDDLVAVGLWYDDFDQVMDEDVAALLAGNPPVAVDRRDVTIAAGEAELRGDLAVPHGAIGLVVFAHGSGSGRLSPRNRHVASALNVARLGTLLLDLLSADEETERARVFDIELLSSRLAHAIAWVRGLPDLAALPIGLFGASTGAAAALTTAAELPDRVGAVVSRGGRPDLAGGALAHVRAPTLLIVGGADQLVLELNRKALYRLHCEKQLEIVPGATHLFEEPGALGRVAELAAAWFSRHLDGGRGGTG